jgi:hypothetical protein
MSLTRAALDRKITELEARTRRLAPRAVARRSFDANVFDYSIGAVLTLVGGLMAWFGYRRVSNQPKDLSRSPEFDVARSGAGFLRRDQ